MSFLGGLLSPGLTALTNGVSAYQGAQAKEADKQKSEALQQIMFLRSQHEQELKDALTQAQTKRALRNPVQDAIDTAQGVSPIKTQEAINTAQGVSPITTATAVNTAKGVAPIKVQEATDTAKAVSPITTQTAVNTARGEAPIKVQQAIDTANGEVPAKVAVQQQAGTASRAVGKQFDTQNKQLTDEATKYAGAKSALAQAKAGNPAAYKAGITNFVSVVDANPQMRQGILQYLSKVDPSIGGQWDIAVNRLTSGTLPSRVIQEMEQVMDAKHAANRALYEQRYQAQLARHPDATQWLTTPDEIFNIPGASTPPTATSGKGTPFTYGGKTYVIP